MIWKEKETDPNEVERYVESIGITRNMAKILINRGITRDQAQSLYTDTRALVSVEEIYGMSQAVDTIMRCMPDHEIHIFGDYDVDGLMSGYIINDYLSNEGYESELYIPSREEGYGLNVNWAKVILQNARKPVLVITVDNGITANEAVEVLKNGGATVVIIDHHEPNEVLPPADAICDAWIDRNYGTHLCCAEVVWKVILEIEVASVACSIESINTNPFMNEKRKQAQIDEIYNIVAEKFFTYVPYAALGAISDVMPPHIENYAIISLGLDAINNNKAGIINALKNVEGIEKMRTKDISWTIAPELNACSRMGDIDMALTFIMSDPDDKKKVSTLAKAIMNLNKRRKTLTDNAFKKIEESNDFSSSNVCIADAMDCPVGLIGILAGKLAEKEGKPAIVYKKSDGEISTGSCRSVNGIDIKAIINKIAEENYVAEAAGHAEACGVKLYNEHIDMLRQRMNDLLKDVVNIAEHEEILLDTVLTPDELIFPTRNEINGFGYTSSDIPVLGILNQEVKPIAWETSSGKKHLLLEMTGRDGKKKYAVMWNGWDIYEAQGCPTKVNMAGTLESGSFCKYCKAVKISETATMFCIDILEAA